MLQGRERAMEVCQAQNVVLLKQLEAEEQKREKAILDRDDAILDAQAAKKRYQVLIIKFYNLNQRIRGRI